VSWIDEEMVVERKEDPMTLKRRPQSLAASASHLTMQITLVAGP
jgi:hypothetical protein